jgi:hypothetical protein
MLRGGSIVDCGIIGEERRIFDGVGYLDIPEQTKY